MTNARPMKSAVFDIDGTLALMDKTTGSYTALPGAVEALAACRKAGAQVVAYTNGTFFPPEHYYPRLAEAGLVFDPGHIVTPAVVAARHLVETGHRRVMILGAEGTMAPLREAGLDIVPPQAKQGNVDAILIGWTPQFSLPELEALAEAVWNGARPYTVSDAPYFAGANGRILGVSGAVSAMVRQVTDVTPVVLGKPSTIGMDLIAAMTSVRPEETVVIGDDPSLEIRMARRAGAYGVGVTTGLYDRHAFMRAPSDERAHLIVDTLEGFFERWLLQERGEPAR